MISMKSMVVKFEITRTKDLVNLIAETFPPALGLHGSPLMLHDSGVNPTDYALAYLVRDGLRDAEITVAFT